MTGMMNHNPDDARVMREEVLIGRVTDGEASPSDWAEIESMARNDPSLWQRLAQSQRAHARIESAVEDAIAVSEFVELPRHSAHVNAFSARWREYAGWAAAAVLGLAWIGIHQRSGHQNSPMSGSSSMQQANIIPISSATPDQAYDRYLEAGKDDGRIVAVLPAQMVDASEVGASGKRDIFIVRPVIERVKATDVQTLRVSTDEHGRQTFVPMGQYKFSSGSPGVRVE